MTSSDVGRPIHGKGLPSTREPFGAKEESIRDRVSQRIVRLGVSNLRVIAASGERMLYSRDQSEIPRILKTFAFRTHPDAVVQPLSVEALSAVLRHALSEGVTIVPRGAGSSPFGGSVPVMGGIVVDMSRMDAILEVNEDDKTITVQAGARWADIDHELSKSGLRVPTCPSSKFSTVGGWIATGGLGINSYSKGHLSANVLSLELVSPDGVVRRLSQADPGFAQVFGSEGQLGVVATATIALAEIPRVGGPHLLLFDSSQEALEFAGKVLASDVGPGHVIFESESKIRLVSGALGGEHLKMLDAVVVSLEGQESEERFAKLLKKLGVSEQKEYVARYLWNERFFPMKMRTEGPGMLGAEVLMPTEKLGDAMDGATAACKAMGLDPMFEIHYLPDGEALMLCFFLADQGNTFAYTVDAFKSLVLARLLIDAGARPYSIGIWNHAFSDHMDRTERESLERLKAKLDPLDIMNTGKYFALSGRWAGLGGKIFDPRVMKPILEVIVKLPTLSFPLLGMLSGLLRERFDPKRRDRVVAIADECAMCGSCVSVCPAYQLTGDERVTARGKLITAKAVAGGFPISQEHAHRIFLCMKCKACEQVCQSKLELIPAFEEFEGVLEKSFGKDTKEIERFLRFAERSPVYDALIANGLVVGAPRHERGGELRDV
ncbi:MAG: FAD-binding protein [Candidatus Thermoplasmatota archaeon]|nr:FAD-binding protein [Candidatus Thermoplasmatota archaeon]